MVQYKIIKITFYFYKLQIFIILKLLVMNSLFQTFVNDKESVIVFYSLFQQEQAFALWLSEACT
jgi:hypothetical protein